MRYILPLFLAVFFISFSACRKDDITTTKDVVVPDPGITIETQVHGLVVDESGNPVEDAVVRMGDAQTNTNEAGYFNLEDFQSSSRALVFVQKEGYFDAFPVFTPNEESREFLTVQMIERNLSATLQSASGGEVALNGGSKVDFAGGSFVLPNGDTYSGSVNVYAYWLDPTDSELYQYMPGNLTAINSEDELRGLVTYGMINVELETPSGEELDINQAATIEMPVPAELQSKAPQSIPLWYYDEGLGLWVEEGAANLTNNTYIGEVNHFTFWNCDIPFPFVEVSGQVDVNGYAPYVEVRLTRLDNGDQASDHTDDKGYFDGKVPEDVVFLLEIINTCGTVVHSEEVGPFTADTNLGVFEIALTDDWSVVSGNVVDCDANPVSNGLVSITNSAGTLTVLRTLPNGNFNSLIGTCQGSSIDVYAIDIDEQLQSDIQTFSVADVMDLGTIDACDNQVVSGVQYNINGAGQVFVPYCTVTVGYDNGNPQIYTFQSTYTDDDGDKVITEFNFLDWNADPSNPLYGMSFSHTLLGNPDEYWSPGQGDLNLNFAGYNPGDLIQFEISGCNILEEISGTNYPGSSVVITGIVQ
ncbi:MAG: hypothetical protein GYB31_14920 [Bacteroidetes bacterium]|nr:hypothetical protein [Bacteroidota bacterium]